MLVAKMGAMLIAGTTARFQNHTAVIDPSCWREIFMGDIRIWGRKSSVNVQLVLWALDEMNLAYQRVDAGFIYGVVDTDAFKEMNPNGRVPVLIDGDGQPIFESAAIVRYLASQYGDDVFWPKDAAARAQIDKWAEWAKWNFGHVFIMNLFWKLVRTPADEIDHDGIAAALVTVETMLAMADAKLATSAYLAGDDFTLADIAFGYCLYRYYDIDVVRRDLPHLRRYYGLLSQRPAYQSHVMVSYDALRV
jgi:glutathione S-transferase